MPGSESLTISWGIIGCGDVCERKSGPAFQNATGSRLVAVMRRNRGLAEDFARRHGVPRAFDDADALVSDPGVDAVYVATPPGTHLEHALRACRAGKPAYVEKPMARSHEECLVMLHAFQHARIPLFVAYYRRALERFRTLRELVLSGRIGTVTGIEYRYAAPHHLGLDPTQTPWRLSAENGGGGLLLDLGSHVLDLLDFIFGPLMAVNGSAANCASAHELEDTVAMSFVTSNGVPGTAHWSFAAAVRADRLTIDGTEGQISVPVFADEPLHVVIDGRHEAIVIPHPSVIQQPLIQSVVGALEAGEECASTGVSAARTSQVMDRILSSYYGARSGAFWQDPSAWPGARGRARTA